MSSLGDRLLTEKTRILVTISNFIMLIFAIVSGVVFVVNWKADVEHRLLSAEESIAVIVKEKKAMESLQLEIQLQLVGIQTDLKWIVNNMTEQE